MTQQASLALQPLADTLAADGYNLQVEETPSHLELIVTATQDACAECLVPKSIFKNMATMVLRENGVVLNTDLQITYPESHHES
jgi:hypothetical protein